MTSAAFFHVRVLQIQAFLAAMSVAASQAHGVSCFGFMAYVCISPLQVSRSHVIFTSDQREKYLLRGTYSILYSNTNHNKNRSGNASIFLGINHNHPIEY